MKRRPAMMKNEWVGRRVRLIRCTDEYTRLEPGATGTVSLVDNVGTVHVRWDDGHTLGLCEDAGDEFEFISDPTPRRT